MATPVLYVVGLYPNWSETFVAQDIALLREQGLPVLVASLFRPALLPRQDGIPGGTVYVGSAVRNGAEGRPWTAPVTRMLPRAVRTRLARWRHRGAAARLGELAVAERVVHMHGEFADLPGLLAATVARRLRLPYSLGVHARDVHVLRYAPRAVFGEARFVTVCNAAARDRLLAVCPWLGDRVHLIAHGLRLSEWPFVARPRPGVAGGPWRVLFVGRFVAKKGIEVLLEAMARVRATAGPEVELTLVGAGPLEAELRRRAAALGVLAATHWAGVVSRTEVGARMRAADCLVMPSVVGPDGDRDGIPNVVLEAMASGTPVVASAVGGIPEALTAETGWPCRPGDAADLARALTEVRGDPQRTAERAKAARAVVAARFDAEALARTRFGLFAVDGQRKGV